MMVSRVQGPLEEGTAGNPGTRQAKMRNCSSAQLSFRACSHSRKRRIPSQRIYTGADGSVLMDTPLNAIGLSRTSVV